MIEIPHRLLHTLVFSSSLALSACAGAPEPSAQGRRSAPRAAATSSASASSGPAAPASSSSAGSATTASDGLAAIRSCETGWPTTKGATCESTELEDGRTATLCCSSFGDNDCCEMEQE